MGNNVINIKTKEVLLQPIQLDAKQAVQKLGDLETILRELGIEEAATLVHKAISKVSAVIMTADLERRRQAKALEEAVKTAQDLDIKTGE